MALVSLPIVSLDPCHHFCEQRNQKHRKSMICRRMNVKNKGTSRAIPQSVYLFFSGLVMTFAKQVVNRLLKEILLDASSVI